MWLNRKDALIMQMWFKSSKYSHIRRIFVKTKTRKSQGDTCANLQPICTPPVDDMNEIYIDVILSATIYISNRYTIFLMKLFTDFFFVFKSLQVNNKTSVDNFPLSLFYTRGERAGLFKKKPAQFFLKISA